MFPFIRLFAPFRQYLIGFFYVALFGYQMSQLVTPELPDETRLSDVASYESFLTQKAETVLSRFDADVRSIDLSVSIDHNTVTVTTYDPGHSVQECREIGHQPARCDQLQQTLKKEVSDSPRVGQIKVCVTLNKTDDINKDELFRALSYALGINLSRGDLLRLVFL